MPRSPRRFVAFFLLAAMTLAWACDRHGETPGVVATVNGRPVTIGQLEFNHDLRGLGLVAVENPTVESLRQDYGRIMADLIVRELMLDELARSGHPVTEEDVARLEKEIRADYPPEVFDRMLFEESIDPGRWRESLLTRVTLDKFAELILKDRVTIEVQEAADYYKRHVAEFRRPEQVTFLVVRGPDRKLVEAALRQRDSGQTFPKEPSPDQASVREARLPREAIPESWRGVLAKLKPGQAGPVTQRKGEALALVLIGETPAHTLDPAAAYPLVEKILAERKRNAAFSDWLAAAVASADITISAHLLRNDAAAISEAPSPDILIREFPGVGAFDGEHAARLADTGQVSRSLAERFASQPETEGEEPAAAAKTESLQAGQPGSGDPGAGDMPAMLRVVPEREPEEEPEAGQQPETRERGEQPSSPAQAAPETAAPPDETPTGPAVPPQAPAGPADPEEGVQAAPPADQPPRPEAGLDQAAPSAASGPGEVEFYANKASWIIFKVDDGKEERIYLKNGKKQVVSFKRKLSVRFGSPSDVSYRFRDRQERVESSAREVKSLDFP